MRRHPCPPRRSGTLRGKRTEGGGGDDAQLVLQTEGTLHTFASTPASVLLLGGSKSPAYLKTFLDALASVLPQAQRAELAGGSHLAPDNTGDPERVARELRSFYAN